MSLRRRGVDVHVDGDGLAAAFPDATPRVVVFLHGLCESDESWWRAARRHHGDRSTTYGSLLRRDLGYTPLYVRYNSGLHISDNGRRLAELLDDVVRHWPVPLDELVLVGHSMGGLVARSACHYAEADGRTWTARLRHVFCLGTPHLGAPLERGAHTAQWVLSRLPETRPVARILDRRSVGVKDLRFGACVEDDWRHGEPDEFLRDRCTEVPFLPDVAYYFIGVTLTRDAGHPVAALVGDLLVQFPSASGKGRRRKVPFEVDNGAHLGGLHHFDLLNHPSVYEQLHRWLAAGPAVPAAPRELVEA